MEREILLKAQDIKKSFATVQVLKGVNFEIAKGEVHALMGENGAGKSTLIKIITGAYSMDSGQIFYNGEAVSINSRADAQGLGIACIYQELSLIPTLSVAQNILIGKEPKIGITPLVNKKKANQIASELIEKYKFPLNAQDTVETLTIAQQQMVEILKALTTQASLIIMDEPTASLSGKEAETLFEIIENLRKEGVSVLYISHRLEEVYRLSDRLTVLRDGNTVAVLEKEEIVPAEVIRLMIGKEVEDATNKGTMVPNDNEVVLKLENCSRLGFFEKISFEAKAGEILGFGGLVGSGRTEIMRCIFGADSFDEGSVFLNGSSFSPQTVQKSIGAGIGLVPEDRRAQGFVPKLSIQRNIALPNYDLIKKTVNAISNSAELKMAESSIQDLSIRPSNPNMHVINMSGGNQQKVVLAKWLQRDLKVLIIDEPTAGIDVGAKEEIYNLLRKLAAKGVVILLVSSDLQELIRVSTRILVMRKGHIVKEFAEGYVTQDDVLGAASGIAMGGETE